MKRSKIRNSASKPSIRTRLLVYFISFTTLGLFALFFFQSLFLDDLYEIMTFRTVKSAANDMTQAVLEGDIEERAAYWNVRERVSVYVVSNKGTILFQEALEGERRDGLSKEALMQLFSATEKNGGTYFTKSEMSLKPPNNELHGKPAQKPPSKPSAEPGKPNEQDEPEFSEDGNSVQLNSVLYSEIVTDRSTNSTRMVVISSVVVPVYATLRTLQIQFFAAAFVLALMAALFSIYVAGRIARPIRQLNRAAKQLASDDYQSPPQGGYREAAELRQTLDDTAKELKKVQQLQKELIANLSHDLRTPLTMITGYSEAIRDFPEDDVAENIQVVIDEANHLTKMVNDILDLSRLQAGTQPISMSKVYLTQTLRDTVERFEEMMQPHGYHVTLSAEESVFVKANEVRLSQIVYNLLGNALAHVGDDKTVQVSQVVQGDMVRVDVIDHGEGIPPEELDHIWERYYRARSHANVPETDRSGLGLNIVKTLVQLHGGEYGVESEQGKGSTFWFALPLYEK